MASWPLRVPTRLCAWSPERLAAPAVRTARRLLAAGPPPAARPPPAAWPPPGPGLPAFARWCGLSRSSTITCTSPGDYGFNQRRPLATSDTHSPRSSSKSRVTSGQDGTSNVFITIYRFPGIRVMRFISRLKNVQTIFMVVALPPVYYLHTQGLVNEHSLWMTSGVATLACCSLYGISHYLRRLVGLMALSADGRTLRVSHLSFWGTRRDRLIPVEDVVPLSEGSDQTQDPLLALRCYSHRDVLYFSLRYGRVLDGTKFRAVFGNSFMSPER